MRLEVGVTCSSCVDFKYKAADLVFTVRINTTSNKSWERLLEHDP